MSIENLAIATLTQSDLNVLIISLIPFALLNRINGSTLNMQSMYSVAVPTARERVLAPAWRMSGRVPVLWGIDFRSIRPTKAIGARALYGEHSLPPYLEA